MKELQRSGKRSDRREDKRVKRRNIIVQEEKRKRGHSVEEYSTLSRVESSSEP
jgi:hypothetical protein